jgi:hypothetical protein
VKVENLEKVFDAFGKKTVQTARGILNAKGKNTSGNLADSLGYHLKVYSSGALEMQFLAAGYAKFVDEGVSGTKKKYKTPYSYTNKQPPSGVIDKWVVRKGLKAARDSKGKFIKRKSLVFLIARSIKLYGVEPTHFFSDALNEGLNALPPQIARAYAKDAAKFLERVTQEI